MSAAETIAAMAARRGMFADAEKALDEAITQRDNYKDEVAAQAKMIATLEAQAEVKDAEIARLTSLVEAEQTRVRMLQAFGTSMNTQIEIIEAVISKAKREVGQQVQRLGIRVQNEDTPEEKSAGERAAEILNRVQPTAQG
jgi:hypothetical protein